MMFDPVENINQNLAWDGTSEESDPGSRLYHVV